MKDIDWKVREPLVGTRMGKGSTRKSRAGSGRRNRQGGGGSGRRRI